MVQSRPFSSVKPELLPSHVPPNTFYNDIKGPLAALGTMITMAGVFALGVTAQEEFALWRWQSGHRASAQVTPTELAIPLTAVVGVAAVLPKQYRFAGLVGTGITIGILDMYFIHEQHMMDKKPCPACVKP